MNSSSPKIFSPLNWAFWKAYVIHMRPYLLFLSGVAGLSGMALVSDFRLNTIYSILPFIAFFLAYGFGQALTDCFQVDTDKISSPYRPLSQGIIIPKHVGIVSIVGLITCATILINSNSWNILFGLLTIIGLITYSYVKRHFWFGGPFHNAWIVALLPIMGYLVSSKVEVLSLSNSQLIYIVLLNFFAYANFVLIGYLKDITADLETGYKTFPVIFGWNATVWVGDLFLILSILIGTQLISNSIYAIIIFIIASVISVLGQLYAHFTKKKSEENASFPITATVRSFILWNLAFIIEQHSSMILFSLAFYLVFELALYLRPIRTQI